VIHAGLWLPIACAIVAVGLMAAGALQLVRAHGALERHLESTLLRQARIFDTHRLAGAMARIDRDANEAALLSRRAKVAMDDIGRGLAEMRIPEAIRALRLGIAALRALRGLL